MMVRDPTNLGEFLRAEDPGRVYLDPAEGEKRTELYVTRMDEGASLESKRVDSEVLVEVSMSRDIAGYSAIISGEDVDGTPFSYEAHNPQEVLVGEPKYEQELGDILIGRDGGKQVAISQFYREK